MAGQSVDPSSASADAHGQSMGERGIKEDRFAMESEERHPQRRELETEWLCLYPSSICLAYK